MALSAKESTISDRYDIGVVGAGLIGLATATALAEALPGATVLVLDKEDDVAVHQSGHNSGVVHSGLYYRPGSLKARLCVEGRDAVYELADRAGVPARRTGKLVVATDRSEIPALDELERRGRANGLEGLRRLHPDEIAEFEPHATGVAALHVPEAGIADYPALARHLADGIAARNGRIATSHPVLAVRHLADGVAIDTPEAHFTARVLVNCAGLQSDRVARMAGVRSPVRITPFRGEYYRLSESASDLVRSLIYPVPDPRFPFLGVHFTRRIDGTVEVGPNAVLALGREHYRGARPDWGDVVETLRLPGFRKLALRHWRSGLAEMVNSRSTRRYAALARRLVPDLQPEDLLAGGAGVRAQALAPDGALVDDFVISEAGNSIHVLNAPSPGATASLAIGRYVAERTIPLIQN